MRKLQLDVGGLRVESFHVQPFAAATEGTVRGHGTPYNYGETDHTGCGQESCAISCGGYTCGITCESCVQTCGGSCNGTCQVASACYPCGESQGGSCFWQDCSPTDPGVGGC